MRRQFAQEKMEKELMGKNVPVYNNDKYGEPSFGQMRRMGCANSAQVRAADVRRYSLECIEIDANKIPEFPFVHITEFGVWNFTAQGRYSHCDTAIPCNILSIDSQSVLTKRLWHELEHIQRPLCVALDVQH